MLVTLASYSSYGFWYQQQPHTKHPTWAESPFEIGKFKVLGNTLVPVFGLLLNPGTLLQRCRDKLSEKNRSLDFLCFILAPLVPRPALVLQGMGKIQVRIFNVIKKSLLRISLLLFPLTLQNSTNRFHNLILSGFWLEGCPAEFSKLWLSGQYIRTITLIIHSVVKNVQQSRSRALLHPSLNSILLSTKSGAFNTSLNSSMFLSQWYTSGTWSGMYKYHLVVRDLICTCWTPSRLTVRSGMWHKQQ